ncbi:hypothetical protein, partial [Staphylococcus epidermidis]|uniref:hypothetical protein n=1 Tax=Staphylococcus epidermidis TaxID=1282 RepID=UPI0011A751AA
LEEGIAGKEGVGIENECKRMGCISLEKYLRMYNKLGGMSGRGKREEEEFGNMYNMRVREIGRKKGVEGKDN